VALSLDGIITTFAVVAAAAAAKLAYGTILIIGFANLLGDAVGMGIGEYISSKAEDDHEAAERKREEWEVENMPEIEKQEMVEFYTRKGLSEEDAKKVVNLLWESKSAFLDVMMIEELGMIPVEASSSAWKSALITFAAFVVLGGTPLVPYLVSGKYKTAAALDAVFWSAVGLFSLCLYILGAFKGKITGKQWWKTGLTMFFNGAFTTALAYFIGFSLEKFTKHA